MEERSVARTRFSRLLGSWHSGWTRSKNLIHWLSRAVCVCSTELGLALSPEDSTVCGDHLLAVVNCALQTLPPSASPQFDTEFPPLTVNELRRLVATQPAGALRLYYDFESGRLRVGCFHGYALTDHRSRHHSTAAATTRSEASSSYRHSASSSTTRIHVFRRAQLDRRLQVLNANGGGEDVESCLLRCVADQPLDAMHFTYRYAFGELLIAQHVPPLVYCPATSPLLLDEVGAPLLRRSNATPHALYHPLTDQYNDVVFHDTVASRVGDILEHGLVSHAPHGEVYLWSWALAPTRGRRRHDARFYVSLRRAMREGGLRFFMSHEGSIICPSPIPMRFLELDEPHHRRG